MSGKRLGSKNESVFLFGYPWTNTLQDQYVLIEGSASYNSMLIELNMTLDPVHSGSPLFNARQEVVGMVLLEDHAKAAFPVKGSLHFAIPALLLEKSLKAARINATSLPKKNLTKEALILKSRNNIVLIEAS